MIVGGKSLLLVGCIMGYEAFEYVAINQSRIPMTAKCGLIEKDEYA